MFDSDEKFAALQRYALDQLSRQESVSLDVQDLEERFGMSLPTERELARWNSAAGGAFRVRTVMRGMRTDPPELEFRRP